jgi:aspartyl-tRNA(Asn)/glutamyl-tRNA(Gln) amidotransferase subunit C
MPLGRDEVRKIGELARLELSQAETESFTAQLGSILSYVEKLNEVDTEGIEPMSRSCAVDEGQTFRPAFRLDAVQPSLGQTAATQNAPDAEAGYFRVPRVIGG